MGEWEREWVEVEVEESGSGIYSALGRLRVFFAFSCINIVTYHRRVRGWEPVCFKHVSFEIIYEDLSLGVEGVNAT